MVVPTSTGATTTTATTVTTNNSSNPPATTITAKAKPSPASGSRPTTRAKNGPPPVAAANALPSFTNASTPFSARISPPLDMSTVERRGQRETSKRIRPHGLQEAPTFRPTEEEFKDPLEYVQKIAEEGRKYGIVKIIPPENWNPGFAIDTEKFHFRTRRQELNSVEGGTRANLNYLDQLAKFHKQLGTNLNRFPSVDKRPLDLYRLKKAVETRGGFEKVCKFKKWAEIGRDLGYSGKIMSSLSTSLKNSYQRWLSPYEDYLRVAKPGVQQQLEFEHGGPFTPSPAESPLKKSQQNTPTGFRAATPVLHASVALDATMKEGKDTEMGSPAMDAPRPVHSSGFTPVNHSSFTAVNSPAASFTAVNSSNGFKRRLEDERTPPRTSAESPLSSSKNTPEFRSSVVANVANGASSNHLKRKLSEDGMESPSQKDNGTTTNGESESGERRSKRLKKEATHTVAGSHMSLLRPLTPKILGEPGNGKPGEKCEGCGKAEDPTLLLSCDSCDSGYHNECLDPPITSPPENDWHCPRCLVGTGEYGFEEGGIYSLKQFQEKAHNFKESYFRPKMPFDPVLNCKRPVTEDDVEREFWRLVESLTETVEVEYGADIHSTTHGSGFPTIEKNPLDPYSTDPWNLNILPVHPESLFRHIKSDISGMTVPWLYVGMCFSTFCWHNEDHYTYSANYQHFGATKTWYGIPGEDAQKFEDAMREAVPELFETQPDLLFQLVTLLPPDQLKKAGVRVYALDQRAGQFVVSFPQAYHAGFNHGFNFNEAVNFAPTDWEPFGAAGVERLQTFRRQPCFSHDELLLTAAARDTRIKTAQWLSGALKRLQRREVEQRKEFKSHHQQSYEHRCELDEVQRSSECACKIDFGFDIDSVPEEESQCTYCKAYIYLSRFVCHKTSKALCLLHAGTYECCEMSEQERFAGHHHSLRYRVSDTDLISLHKKVNDKALEPKLWADKLAMAIDDDPTPPLKVLRSLLSEGERIAYELPQLPNLKEFVERCNGWVERATNYIVRKQQNRRKNERAWRKGNPAKVAEMEERDRELRKIENVTSLLEEARELAFSCPEITQLQARADAIFEFQQDIKNVLKNPGVCATQYLEDLVEQGKGYNVDIPEAERLERVMHRLKWNDRARELRQQHLTLKEVSDLIQDAENLKMPEANELFTYFKEQKKTAELWESKAKELMSAETVHYQQLEALSGQASTLPVTQETLAAVDQILNKQREAHRQIMQLYEDSKNPDFRKRPKYKDVKEVMDALVELNSKPNGTLDLEKEQKRHEDWMRKGKKLFGKANAPLHILLMHMKYVESRNAACFDIKDDPRAPAEPASREHTPDNTQSSNSLEGSGRERDVFCICRQPESGMMIECELCHEWYHGKCLKIARGKVKEDDKYTCPICDWRVKIPRDAARPKLEDLEEWQNEIPNLPFQPDEEDCLKSIIDTAQEFRTFVQPYLNPLMTTQEEVPTQRFYLRKVEGAEILLTWETNFFRQELHRWAPVAPEAPPYLEHSLSTRKPRPTKQQKLMAQLGIDNPENLPHNLRTRQHNFNRRKSSEPNNTNKVPPPPAASLQLAPGRPLAPATLASNTIITPATAGPSITGFKPSAHHHHHSHHPTFTPDPPPHTSGGPTFAYEGNFSLASPGNGHPRHPHHHHGSPTFPPSGFMSSQHDHLSHSHAHPPNGPYDTNVTLGTSTLDADLFNGSGSGPGPTELVNDNSVVNNTTSAESQNYGSGAGGNGITTTANMDSIFANLTHQDDSEAIIGLESSPAPPTPKEEEEKK